ncbi:hypothetical protein [uncultured Ruegeria sp.]|uniref:hypothetical protein n=1 Tax=uncultured Ruegeria sp. TaxID=259304 RepID=UPI00262489F3|nr:hypothetical protein [uncultured Ruegeria sp.]
MEGEITPFLWTTIIGLWVWLMFVLGHYAADIGADKKDDVELTAVFPATGEAKSCKVNKHELQSSYRPLRYAAFCVFIGGCIGMAVAAVNAGYLN